MVDRYLVLVPLLRLVACSCHRAMARSEDEAAVQIGLGTDFEDSVHVLADTL